MNHLVIFAHPRADSFNGRVLQAYVDELKQCGHTVVVRDLYRMNFDPVLSEADLIAIERGAPPPDIAREQDHVRAAQVLTFITPIWWMSLPAMLKGYFDRVFSHGFAYALEHGEFTGLLRTKKAVVFSTLASTLDELRASGADRIAEAVEDLAIIRPCGMDVLKHVFFAPLASGRTSPEMVDLWLEETRQVVRELF